MWGNNPACLRVQAQLQRRARSCQQAAEGGRRGGGGEGRGGGEGAGRAGGEARVPSEVQSEVPSGEGACAEVNGASNTCENGEEEVASPPASAPTSTPAPCTPAPHSISLDDSEDTITTLPEEGQKEGGAGEGDGTKEFEISPSPSPEKLGSEGMEPAPPSDVPSSGSNPGEFPDRGGEATVTNTPNANANNTTCGPRTISANTVPSCDPSDLGHLLPQEVEMPHGFGAVRAVACGSQHCLLLTTHGALYSWGRNMSGQLGEPGVRGQQYI
ncbi:hypothetical protein GWK47_011547 [Chionoecetes opilio]|uniref:Regulator of chromosome condensation n=1 Tax=Chionoecetes opilio TaxID=41210 RepID=A0A8J5CM87_CHIOP|nr:hypothetical protein GWK47_011547 [Chionoecetes opilio]